MPRDDPAASSAEELAARLDQVTLADARRLERALRRARGLDDHRARGDALADLSTQLAAAEAHLDRRRRAVPSPITFPAELPVAQRHDELAAAIEAHQVVVVAGETGSGKTTQLPKLCLELGRGVRGMIGHTQPRRLAARTVADRIAEELGVTLGGAVGYAVRFTDQVGDETLVKLMTDGLLLAELRSDRDLLAYDTVIVDEAHERSLNVDVLVGHLTHLRRRRPDLKIIITSATIDPEAFARHFDGAPVIEVSGRTYPVEVRYRPLGPTDAQPERPVRDLEAGVLDAVRELAREGPGDVLVFLSGEREIRDVAAALEAAELDGTEVLPLYARLPVAQQRRAFAPHRGRRIVLATNVAETSITVPGIRYVVDAGTARISRYSPRLKVQRLPIEPVSRASAAQRAGRCGRVAPGTCIRLYDEADHDARPEYTEPEILRTNLASVILQLAALGLGDVAAFPFLDPPDRRAVADGVRVLHELGAVELDDAGGVGRLTATGRRLARLPVDPRFGRMVLEADRQGCLRQVLVIAAALAIEDPRERPADRRDEADALHARFAEPGSDLLALWNLWTYWRQLQRELSGNQLRRRCRDELLNHQRLREWQDVHAQLRRVAGDLGLSGTRGEAHPDDVHRALLSGLLSHVGQRLDDGRDYRGARNARFTLWPGSSLTRRPPSWVVVAELVETSRLFGRTAARVEPAWVEQAGDHLVRRRHDEPVWSATEGHAVVHETVTLFGLPLATDRRVPLHRLEPAEARRWFIRHALVLGDWDDDDPTVVENRALLEDLGALEDRFRRRDLVAGPAALADRYDQLLGPEVVSARTFRRWRRRHSGDGSDQLALRAEDLLARRPTAAEEAAFPEWWHQGELRLALSYVDDPSDPCDGVTVHLPVAVVNQVRPDGFDWLVPGLRAELVEALVRSLPKGLRRALGPAADTASALLATVGPEDGPLLEVVATHLSRLTGEPVSPQDLDRAALAPHLRMTFRVEDAQGHGLAEGEDLVAVARQVAPAVRSAVAEAAPDLVRSDVRRWDLGTLPRRVLRPAGGATVVGYPALVDEGEAVAVRVLGDAEAAHEATWAGNRRLVRLAVPLPVRAVRDRLGDPDPLALTANPEASLGALVEACLITALDEVLGRHGAPVWDAEGFAALVEGARAELAGEATDVAAAVARVLSLTRQLDARLAEPVSRALQPTYDDVADQRAALVRPGFVADAGAERLGDLARYLQAALARLETAERDPQRDRERMAEVREVEEAYARTVAAAGPAMGGATAVELERLGWLLEELRVERFAQHVGTRGTVSVRRVRRAIEQAGSPSAR